MLIDWFSLEQPNIPMIPASLILLYQFVLALPLLVLYILQTFEFSIKRANKHGNLCKVNNLQMQASFTSLFLLMMFPSYVFGNLSPAVIHGMAGLMPSQSRSVCIGC